MKILFVAKVYNHLTAFHLPYIQYFQSKGYEVWAAGTGDEDKAILQKLNVHCIDIPFSRSPLSSENLSSYKQLKELFKTQTFELVHVHTPVAALLTRGAFRGSKHGKMVYTAHGFHFFSGAPKQNWLIYYPAEKLAAKWTDHLITINEEDYQNAKKLLPANKVSYVHGVGVEFASKQLQNDEKQNLKKQLGLSPEAVVISFVAELTSNKNHQFLLNNWQKLKQSCPQLELLVIGTGDNEQQLKGIVSSENLEGIHFLGYRRDVPSLLQISDIVTLLSHREGLPKSIMEAMAEGLPCIVTNTRGLRDLVMTNENGYVVNHGDDLALVDAFSRLANSQEIREQMGYNAKIMVKPYLLENVLDEHIKIYENLLKQVK